MGIFIGRLAELTLVKEFLQQDKGLLLVSGESGIGKSAFLNRVCEGISDRKIFVGFHKVWLSEDNRNPFISLISDLIIRSDNTPRKDSKISVRDRLLHVAERVMRQKGDLDGNETAFTQTYLSTLSELSEVFGDHKFLLVLDQVENMHHGGLYTLLDISDRLPERFYMLISFITEPKTRFSGEDSVARYRRLESVLLRIGASKIELKGLSWQEIGKWVQQRKLTQLPKVTLQEIERLSGGWPILIEEWIDQSNLSIRDLLNLPKAKLLDTYYENRLRELSAQTLDFAYRLSTLKTPLNLDKSRRICEMGGSYISIAECQKYSQELEEAMIFDNTGWFRHERVRLYVEKRIPSSLKEKYKDIAKQLLFEDKKKFQYEVVLQDSLQAIEKTKDAFNMGLITTYELADGMYQQYFDIVDSIKILKETPAREHGLILHRSLLEDLLQYCYETNNQLGLARFLFRLAGLEINEKNYNEARLLAKESLDIAYQIGDEDQAFFSLSTLVNCENCLGKHSVASQLLRTNRSLINRSNKPRLLMYKDELAFTEYWAGNYMLSKRYCKQILEMACMQLDGATKGDDLHSYYTPALWAANLLVEVCIKMGDYRHATQISELLRGLYQKVNKEDLVEEHVEFLSSLKGKVGSKAFNRYLHDIVRIPPRADRYIIMIWKLVNNVEYLKLWESQ